MALDDRLNEINYPKPHQSIHSQRQIVTTSTTLQREGGTPQYNRAGDVVTTYNELQQNDQNDNVEDRYQSVDLLRHLPANNWFRKFAEQTAEQCFLPVSTVFLNLLGIFASVACRQWCVQYETGGKLPIGLYVVCEQPPGTGKTRGQNTAQAPFYKIKKESIKWFKSEIKRLKNIENPTDAEKNELHELQQQEPIVFSRLFISNATAEGAENTLNDTGGYFSAVSSEQGLFNSLLGASYSKDKANNNDMVLSGFDGGQMASCRVTRKGYHGSVIGGVVLFAQQGSVETLLSASNGTGLSERFLMLVEPHNLGKRDHFKNVFIDPSLMNEYESRCRIMEPVISKIVDKDDLLCLKLSDEGYRKIKTFQQELEPHLADGEKYSYINLRGVCSKINMQILKIAANLHILTREDSYNPIIEDTLVTAAISMAKDLLESNLAICRAKGLIGKRAEYDSILRVFERKNEKKTERQIIQSRSKVEPFKSFTGIKSKLIRETLDEMAEQKILVKTENQNGATCYLLAV